MRWTVAERYVDSDISAYSGKRRPEYLRMLDDIDAGAIDAVIVYHVDRLHRHPRELDDFNDLCQRTKTKIATVSGDVDLSTHEGQLLARNTGAVARKESDDKSRRIRARAILRPSWYLHCGYTDDVSAALERFTPTRGRRFRGGKTRRVCLGPWPAWLSACRG